MKLRYNRCKFQLHMQILSLWNEGGVRWALVRKQRYGMTTSLFYISLWSLCIIWMQCAGTSSAIVTCSAGHEIPHICGAWRCITRFTRSWHSTLSWVASVQPTPSHKTPLVSLLFPQTCRCPSGIFPSDFTANVLHAYLIPHPLRATCLAHLILPLIVSNKNKNY